MVATPLRTVEAVKVERQEPMRLTAAVVEMRILMSPPIRVGGSMRCRVPVPLRSTALEPGTGCSTGPRERGVVLTLGHGVILPKTCETQD